MNHGTSFMQSDGMAESLDFDEETLDSALMELVTSDWSALDDGELLDLELPDLQLPLVTPRAS